MNSELYFNGKKYISAKRGSEISGYNSDYIGQLCRSGKLECRQVGRGWFVSEDSIIEHQKDASEKIRGTIVFPPVSVVSQNASVFKASENLKTNKKEFAPSEVFSFLSHSGMFYALLFIVISAIAFFAYGSNNKQYQTNIAVVSEHFISSEKIFITSFVSKTSKTLALVRDSASVSNVNNIQISVRDLTHSLRNKFDSIALNSYRFISSLLRMNINKTVVVRDDINHRNSVSQDSKTGMIVVPGTGDEFKNEKVKQRIKNSFSDQTQVVPDETGSSGVIKPIFKNTNDQEYLYVLVPVDD